MKLLFPLLAGTVLGLMAAPGQDLGPVAPDFPLPGMTLYLTPSPGQRAALERLLEAQQDPTSPQFHHWITPEQFADRFGLSNHQIARASDWLRAHGFTVVKVARSRTWMVFGGTARLVENAFHTRIHSYRTGGETHFCNATPPAIPAELSDLAMGIGGLDDFQEQPSQSTSRSNLQAPATLTSGIMGPADWATIYNVTPVYASGIDGTGQTIVVAGTSQFPASALADVATFRSLFNQPANAPQVVRATEYPDPGISNTLNEAYLDVEWSGAIAPSATIVYVYADMFVHAIQWAIDNNLGTVITSSGNNTCEQNTTLDTGFYRLLAQQANAQGITWVNDTGDAGAAACDANGASIATGGLGVRFPVSLPEISAIGGLQFNPQGVPYWAAANTATGEAAVSYIPEAAWNASPSLNAVWASGGGASVLFPKPSWQAAPGVPNDNARDLPDVSFEAYAAYFVYRNGGPAAVGGTSASTPSFAGVVALLNHYLVARGYQSASGLGNINPVLYRLARTNPEVFHDITVGSNMVPCKAGSPNCTNGMLGYNAGPGYDQATGLGSIDVGRMMTQWTNQPPKALAVVNGASWAAGAPMAPGSIISIFGVNLASATDNAAALPLSTAMADARVTVGGLAAPLFYVSPGQINAQLPFETALGNQPLVVTTGGVQTAAVTATVAATAPGIFLYNGNYAVAQHGNSKIIGPSSPAAEGETIVLYTTGQGAALTVPVATGAAGPSTPTAQVSSGIAVTGTIGGINAPVVYAGLTAGLVGVLQVNLQVPSGLAAGEYPVVLTIAGRISNAATLPVAP